MKILKASICCIIFSVVLITGCMWLYDDGISTGDNASENNVAAEEMPFPDETVTESSLVTLPIAELETEQLPAYSTVSFTFLGDCILSSNADDSRTGTFKEYAEKMEPSYFFEKAVPYYSDSDFVIANSEFVLSDRDLAKTRKDGTAFWFRSPTSYADIFREGGIDMVTIANNHTNDYGKEGYEDTKAALDSAGIMWGDIENPVYVKKDGITFGIICTKMFGKEFDPIITPVVEDVTANSDIQIMFFHGGTEKTHAPEDWLREMCHKYADMGIDLIVGSHPHVLRPMENYNGTDIIYSLGNFCYGANRLPENRTVIFTETFTFDEDGSYISQDEQFIPFYVYQGASNNWQPAPVTDPYDYSRTMAFMYGASDLPY